MPILGVGTDILHIARLSSLIHRFGAQRLASRILTQKELDIWTELTPNEARRIEFLGIRWAVKEAAYKAMYPLGMPKWKDLSVLKDAGKPVIRVERPSIRDAIGKTHVSVSHDGGLVVAYVVVEERRQMGESGGCCTNAGGELDSGS